MYLWTLRERGGTYDADAVWRVALGLGDGRVDGHLRRLHCRLEAEGIVDQPDTAHKDTGVK